MSEILNVVRRMGVDAGGTGLAWGFLLRVTVLLLVAAFVAIALRRSSAAMRHLVWTLSLIGTLLIPFCSWALPAWQWAVLPQRQPLPSTAPAAVSENRLPSPPTVVQAGDDPATNRLPSARSPHSFAAPDGKTLEARATKSPVPANVDHPVPVPLPHPSWTWPVLFAALWVLGTFLGIVWIGIGVVAAWHVARHHKTTAGSHWNCMLYELLSQCGIRRAIEVRECPAVSVPMTWGLFRRVILVPAGSGMVRSCQTQCVAARTGAYPPR